MSAKENPLFLPKWFTDKHIHLLNEISGYETEDSRWLTDVGILDSKQIHLATNTVTATFLGKNTNFGSGWYSGGAESFYKITEVVYMEGAEQRHKFVAYKAIHTLGDIEKKTSAEAIRMAVLSSFGRCAKIYAVGAGTIVKEFLEEDPKELIMSRSDWLREQKEIIELLASLGLRPANQAGVETIQYRGKLVVVDLGTEDISGQLAH